MISRDMVNNICLVSKKNELPDKSIKNHNDTTGFCMLDCWIKAKSVTTFNSQLVIPIENPIKFKQ